MVWAVISAVVVIVRLIIGAIAIWKALRSLDGTDWRPVLFWMFVALICKP